MVNATLMRRIANEVENLLTQNPLAKDRFIEQLKVFSVAWKKYWSAKDKELRPLTEQPDKSIESYYKYDPDFRCWLPKNPTKLPSNPAMWELDDKQSCYYATLAVIYDIEKSRFAPFSLCEEVLDTIAFDYMQIFLSRTQIFNKDMLDTALKWVKNDIEKLQEKGRKKRKDKNIFKEILNTNDNFDFLLSIAQKVDALVAQPANMEYFREQLRAFFTELQKAKTLLKDKLDKSQAEDMEVPYYDTLLNLLSLPSTLAVEELAEFMSDTEENDITQEIKLQADYTKLTIIHDKRLKGATTPKINDNFWPQNDNRIEDIWNEYKNKGIYGDGKSDIESIFERVKADLAKKAEKPIANMEVKVEKNEQMVNGKKINFDDLVTDIFFLKPINEKIKILLKLTCELEAILKECWQNRLFSKAKFLVMSYRQSMRRPVKEMVDSLRLSGLDNCEVSANIIKEDFKNIWEVPLDVNFGSSELLNLRNLVHDFMLSLSKLQEYYAQKLVETEQKTKSVKKRRITRKAKRSEKKLKPWTDSGDACFIIEENRIKFYYNKNVKDLQLRNETNPHKLLFLFSARNPLTQSEIKKICTEKTRPSDIAKQTNIRLNEKIAAMALPNVPKDIEFVKYDNTSKCYGLWPEIKHKDDVDYV